MTRFIDFGVVKDRVSFADAIAFLSLDVKRSGNQWRGPCSACNTGGDRAFAVTACKGWFCFGLKKGGDQIAPAAHILNLGVKEAAEGLAERAGIVPVPDASTRASTNTSRTVYA